MSSSSKRQYDTFQSYDTYFDINNTMIPSDVSMSTKKIKQDNEYLNNENVSNPQYPDNFSSYIEGLGEGIRFDISDLIQSGQKAFDKSLKLLFPTMLFGYNSEAQTEDNVLQNLEVKTDPSTPAKYNRRPPPMTPTSQDAKMKNIQAALRMRMPSLWESKQEVNSSKPIATPLKSHTTVDEGKVKAGKRISLARLYNSLEVTYFDCNEGILVLGNKRMIFVVKNLDVEGTADVQWYLPYNMISNCTLSFKSSDQFQLELGRSSGSIEIITLSEVAIGTKILQLIQEKRQGICEKSSSNVGSSNSNAATPLISYDDVKDQVFSPKSLNRVNTIVKQIEFGVSDLGIQMKLENEGIDDTKRNLLIKKAKYLLSTKKNTRMTSNLKSSSSAMIISPPRNENSKSITEKKTISYEDIPSKSQFTSNNPLLVQNINDNESILDLGNQSIEYHNTSNTSNTSSSNAKEIINKCAAYREKLDKESQFHSTEIIIGRDNEYISPHLEKFKLMVLNGIPKNAVLMRMNIEKISDDEKSLIFNAVNEYQAEANSSVTSNNQISDSKSIDGVSEDVDAKKMNCSKSISSEDQTSVLHDSTMPLQSNPRKLPPPTDKREPYADSSQILIEIPAHLKKFKMMLKNGIPEQAVINKMTLEKISKSDQDLVLGNTSSTAPTTDAPAQDELPDHLKKFKMMLKNGIPEQAVINKMTLEKISQDDQDLVLGKSKAVAPTASNGELPEHLKKFKMMLKNGIPEQAVINKMTLEKISKSDQDLVLGNSSSAAASDNSGELPEHLKKFKMMLKNGIPEQAVINKMTLEKISQADQDLVLGKSKAVAPTASNGELPEYLKKFKMMLKNGIPEQAVINKMNLEKVTKSDQDLVLGKGAPIAPTASNGELPEHLKKFKMMLKNGIPEQAVINKMTLEKISKSDQDLVLGKGVLTGKAIGSSKPETNKPKLLGLHWDTIDNGNFNSNSIWNKVKAEELSLRSEEFESLVTMFSRREASKLPVKASAETSKKQTKQPSLIDFSRMMSISIILTSFRSSNLDIYKLCAAVDSMDYNLLKLDDVLRVKEILPTDAEVKLFQGLGDLSNDKIEQLADAEKALYKICQITKFREKVRMLIFLSTWEGTVKTIKSNCNIMLTTSQNVINSKGLAEIMRNVLAIGNVMNGGTYKGSASGFRLSSLSKLSQTKSSDGTTTVLDYLIQILNTRQTAGDKTSTIALDVDNELRDITKCKVLSIAEVEKDSKSLYAECNILKSLLEKCDKNIETIANLQGIYDNISIQLVSLQQDVDNTKLMLVEMEGFFGEPANSSNTLMSYIDDFLVSFKKGKDKLVAKEKKEKQQLLKQQKQQQATKK